MDLTGAEDCRGNGHDGRDYEEGETAGKGASSDAGTSGTSVGGGMHKRRKPMETVEEGENSTRL